MSDLFLDTDVRIWYSLTARRLAESPFDLHELESIFFDEVTPVLAGNLLSIAGEWAGFDEAWLVPRITSGLGRSNRRRWNTACANWESVRLLTTALRRLDPLERPARVALWGAVSNLFLHRHYAMERILAVVRDSSPALLESVWCDEVWPAYSKAIPAYHKLSAELNPSVEDVQQAWHDCIARTR